MSGLQESHVDSDEEDLAESIGSFTLRDQVRIHFYYNLKDVYNNQCRNFYYDGFTPLLVIKVL